jgi:hypothetical protein
MKFNFKNIECEFLDWKLSFKRAKPNSYGVFIQEHSPVRQSDLDGDTVDTKKLNPNQMAFLMQVDEKYLASMLDSAECEESDSPENLDQKELLIAFLISESDDFREWAKSYMEGEKKT